MMMFFDPTTINFMYVLHMLFNVIIDSYLSLAIVCVGHSLPHVHAQAAIISRLHHLHLDSLHIWLEWRE